MSAAGPLRWAELNWPDMPAAVARHPVALLPIGAIEEHGPHLPLGTDWYVAESLAAMVATSAELLLLPALPYGQVWSLEHFPGSLSIHDETLSAVLREIISGLARTGVRGVVLLNAHLGNAAAIKTTLRTLTDDTTMQALGLTYPGLAQVEREVAETKRSHPSIMHADELETSVMLALHPERVAMDRAAAEYPEYPEDFDAAAIRWHEISKSGVFGDPTAATAAKGDRIVAHVVDAAVGLIRAWRKRAQL